MIIKTISYSKTFQVKQYEPERIEAVAELRESDDPVAALRELKEFVLKNSLTAQKAKLAKTAAKRRAEIEAELEKLDEIDDDELLGEWND